MFATPKESLPGTPEHDTIQDERIRHLELEVESLREAIIELAWAIPGIPLQKYVRKSNDIS